MLSFRLLYFLCTGSMNLCVALALALSSLQRGRISGENREIQAKVGGKPECAATSCKLPAQLWKQGTGPTSIPCLSRPSLPPNRHPPAVSEEGVRGKRARDWSKLAEASPLGQGLVEVGG
jgi:hypothetical protein